MTFEEIDARYRAAVLAAGGDEWDDPETQDADDDDLGLGDHGEESMHDEDGDPEDDA
jgi:hypothetical protein